MAKTPSYDKAPRYTWDRPKGEFVIWVEVVNPDVWGRFANLKDLFIEGYKPLFLDCVFEAHRYLIRVTPIRTGRLRGGWTSILDKYNQDYTRAFYDVSLLHISSDSEGVLDGQAIVEGVNQSSFMDLYPEQNDITLINQVFYGEYVQFGTSRQEAQYFVDRARYKAELIMTQGLDNWLKDISTAGDIVEPKPVEETVA